MSTMEKMRIVPITQKEAFSFVKHIHRHHAPPRGSIFQIAAAVGDLIVGVVIVGRPVGRGNQNGFTLEVTRLATDGTKNACSMLYAAAWRVCKELGYKRLITYVLESETGGSVIAAGWEPKGYTRGGSWNCQTRPRFNVSPTVPKLKFERSV